MLKLLRRWYRWCFNPRPIPGQFWMVDGVGLVKVYYVAYKEQEGFFGPVFLYVISEYDPNLKIPYKLFITSAYLG